MKHNRQTFAIITPTYHKDLELFKLLTKSIDHYWTKPFRHYVIVSKADLHLFQPFASNHRIIVTEESVLPAGLFKIPGVSSFRFSFKHLPVRKWILQQLIKLSFPESCDEENLIYIDSDVALIKPFDSDIFIEDGKLRLFSVPGKGNIDSHYKWHQTASKLLGLPQIDYHGARYIGQMITWKKNNVLEMHRHIEKITKKPWKEALYSCWNLSEYILYGVFCEKILKERSQHYPDSRNFSLEYWESFPMNPKQEEAFVEALQPNHYTVMISAKAKMDIEVHKRIITKLEKKA